MRCSISEPLMLKKTELISKKTENIFKQNEQILYDLTKDERDKLWSDLNQGVDLLTTHELMCQYIFSYGNMHEAKIKTALSSIRNPQEVFNTDIAIVDWGCGQGLATVCFFDFLIAVDLSLSRAPNLK